MSKRESKGLVPSLRFSEFGNTGNWTELCLSEVGDIITGSTPKTSERENYDGKYIFVSPADISEGRYITETKVTLSDTGFSKTRKIPANSVMFVCIGSTIGKIAQNMVECATNQQINSIVVNDDYVNGFIYYTLDNNSSIIAELAGKQAVPIINKTQFSSVVVSAPQYCEQKKIADCLSSIDSLITLQTQKLEVLKMQKKGLMQQLFPADGEPLPKMRFPEFQKQGAWEVKQFSQLFEIGSGRDYKHLSSGDIPVYGTGGCMLSVDDYLYDGESACIGRKGTINKPMLLSGKFWTVDTLFYTHSFKDCLPKFVFALFQNINWLKYNEAGGVPSLSKVIINNINVRVPPTLQEQEKIVDCLSSIDGLITLQTQKIDALKSHKKGLMQQLFPTLENIE